jgi:hypothetical protein
MDIRAIQSCVGTGAAIAFEHEVVGVVWTLGVIACFFVPVLRDTEVRAQSLAFVIHRTEVPRGQELVLCCCGLKGPGVLSRGVLPAGVVGGLVCAF